MRPTTTSPSAARARSAASSAGSAGHAGQHEHELLAAQAADGVAVARDRAQLGRGGGQRAIALRVALRVVDALEVVEVEHHDAERAPGRGRGVDLAPQALLRAAVVEQAGEPVGRRLRAQVLALARRLVGERRHRREALDERDLLLGERPVGARAVHVERADDAVVGQQRHAHERLVVVGGPRHDGADVVEARVRHVARAPVADDPAGGAVVDRQRLAHDLLHPGAEREHRPQAGARVVDLVDRQVVIGQERLQVMRDPAERVLQRIGGQDPRRCVDQRIERAPACLRLYGHLSGIDPATRPLDPPDGGYGALAAAQLGAQRVVRRARLAGGGEERRVPAILACGGATGRSTAAGSACSRARWRTGCAWPAPGPPRRRAGGCRRSRSATAARGPCAGTAASSRSGDVRRGSCAAPRPSGVRTWRL